MIRILKSILSYDGYKRQHLSVGAVPMSLRMWIRTRK